MAFTFEKLIVYQKAIVYADCICGITEKFPRGYGFLADQLNRASVSIAANIAEGNGRFTIPDRKNFFMIARGSVQECVALMEIAHRRKLVTSEAHVQLRMELEEVSKNALRADQRPGKPQNLSRWPPVENTLLLLNTWLPRRLAGFQSTAQSVACSYADIITAMTRGINSHPPYPLFSLSIRITMVPTIRRRR